MKTEFIVSGYVVGQIWMPATECFKDVSFSFQKENRLHRPFVNVCDSLRDALLQITNDGDFQSCKLACGTLKVRTINERNGRRVVKERYWPIEQFPSVADMVRDDWAPPADD